jgi:phage tail sheath gpL-like
MIFNGHTLETISEIDDVTFANIQTMYADGLVGNYGILTQIATLTNGVFNYMRPANSPLYKLANILGSAYDYIYPPLSDEQKKAAVNDSLLAFMSQAQGFDKTKFGVKDG